MSYGKEERFLSKQNQNEINESKYGHLSLSTDLRNVEDFSVHVCLDAVVFHNPPSDVKKKVSHKNQWLQCPWRASVLLQEDVYPCLREARRLLLLCKKSKISRCPSTLHLIYASTQVVCKAVRSQIWANRTQNSGW